VAKPSETEDIGEKGSSSIYDVQIEMTAVLGTSIMPISQVLKLGRGAVVELRRRVGEDIELHANNQLVARGEITVMEDQLGITITETVKTSATAPEN
jgi:flagellar motor switch protein FliN/FliY